MVRASRSYRPLVGGCRSSRWRSTAAGVSGVPAAACYGLRLPAAGVAGPRRPTARDTAGAGVGLLVLLVGVPVVCALAFVVARVVAGVGTEMLLYMAVVRGVSGLGLAACAVAAWWHLRVRPRPRRPPGPPARSDVGRRTARADGTHHRDEHHGRPRRAARLRPAPTPHAGHHQSRGRPAAGLPGDRRRRRQRAHRHLQLPRPRQDGERPQAAARSASLVLSDDFGGAWVQVDGECEVLDAPESVEPLVEYFRNISGEHPDWDEYRQAMLDQDKSILRITPTRWGPVATGGFPPRLAD